MLDNEGAKPEDPGEGVPMQAREREHVRLRGSRRNALPRGNSLDEKNQGVLLLFTLGNETKGNETKFTAGEVQLSILAAIASEFTPEEVDGTLPSGKETGPWTQSAERSGCGETAERRRHHASVTGRGSAPCEVDAKLLDPSGHVYREGREEILTLECQTGYKGCC